MSVFMFIIVLKYFIGIIAKLLLA
ncbi:MAG TPA: hypothetical protein EYG94_08925 [Campylobacterales bacterium]|nr:hypothetical protein [Campylobacterales bacterium]